MNEQNANMGDVNAMGDPEGSPEAIELKELKEAFEAETEFNRKNNKK